jgi:hypothetical protein
MTLGFLASFGFLFYSFTDSKESRQAYYAGNYVFLIFSSFFAYQIGSLYFPTSTFYMWTACFSWLGGSYLSYYRQNNEVVELIQLSSEMSDFSEGRQAS